jgi:hypothetical protein
VAVAADVGRARQDFVGGAYTYTPAMGSAHDFSIGAASREEADLLGRGWVGADATVLYEKGKSFLSAVMD